jgi:hypothetical protein
MQTEKHASGLLVELHAMRSDYQHETATMQGTMNDLRGRVELLTSQNRRLQERLLTSDDVAAAAHAEAEAAARESVSATSATLQLRETATAERRRLIARCDAAVADKGAVLLGEENAHAATKSSLSLLRREHGELQLRTNVLASTRDDAVRMSTNAALFDLRARVKNVGERRAALIRADLVGGDADRAIAATAAVAAGTDQ